MIWDTNTTNFIITHGCGANSPAQKMRLYDRTREVLMCSAQYRAFLDDIFLKDNGDLLVAFFSESSDGDYYNRHGHENRSRSALLRWLGTRHAAPVHIFAYYLLMRGFYSSHHHNLLEYALSCLHALQTQNNQTTKRQGGFHAAPPQIM